MTVLMAIGCVGLVAIYLVGWFHRGAGFAAAAVFGLVVAWFSRAHYAEAAANTSSMASLTTNLIVVLTVALIGMGFACAYAAPNRGPKKEG